MPQAITREPYVKQSVSLRRDQLTAAIEVARQDYGGFLSRYLQDILTADLRSRFGRDWADQFGAEAAEELAVPA